MVQRPIDRSFACCPLGLLASLICLWSSSLTAQVIEAPTTVRETTTARLVAGPTTAAVDGGIQINFEISAATDVEVAIINADGKVVRHLAAGLLGTNAPSPLAKDTLRQAIVWNICDDAGKKVDASEMTVRVRAGSQARQVKNFGFDGNALLGTILSLRMNPSGDLFVLLADPFRARSELRVLDGKGEYQRTIIPYPASTPPERSAPFGQLKVNGKRQPIVFNGQAHTFHPMAAGLREQTMA